MTARSHFRLISSSKADSRPSLMWTIVTGAAPANRCVILGSPKGGCGKTSLTLFNVSTLASMGARVLLVELTEGQAPMTANFAYDAVDTNEGAGVALSRLIGHVRIGDSFEKTMARLKPLATKEAIEAVQTIRRVQVSPTNPALGFDFMPCGEKLLAEMASSPKMQDRTARRATFTAFLEAIAEVQGGGWDFIFLDILPSAESPIVRAAMGVADSYALVVDMESAAPLPGWGVLTEELGQIMQARNTEGKDPGIFRGMLLNKVAPKKPGLTRKINRLRVNLKIQEAAEEGVDVEVLAEVRNMTTLALLGFNITALQQLSKSYNGAIPDSLDDLTEDDLTKMVMFETGKDASGNNLSVATGTEFLAKLFPSTRKTLDQESRDLLPMLLAVAGEQEASDAYTEALIAAHAAEQEA